MNSRLFDLADTDERLREWAHFFRDRRSLERCRSIESRFRASSEDFSIEGWGDMDSVPSVRPAASYSLLRAVRTHDAVQQLDRTYKWALTFGFCYPSQPRYLVLRLMKKYTGRKFSWPAFLEALDIGRIRIYTTGLR